MMWTRMKIKPVTDEAVKKWVLGLEHQTVEREPVFAELIFTSGICHEETGEEMEDSFSFGENPEWTYVFSVKSIESASPFGFPSSFQKTACSEWAYIAVAAVKDDLAYLVTVRDEDAADAAKKQHWNVWELEVRHDRTFLHREGDSWIMMKAKVDFTVLNEKNVRLLGEPLVRGEQSFTEISIRVMSNSWLGDQTPPGPGGPILVFAKTFSIGIRKDGTKGIYEGRTRGDYPYHYQDTRVLAVDGDTIWVQFSYGSAFQVNAKEGYSSGDGCTSITIK